MDDGLGRIEWLTWIGDRAEMNGTRPDSNGSSELLRLNAPFDLGMMLALVFVCNQRARMSEAEVGRL